MAGILFHLLEQESGHKAFDKSVLHCYNRACLGEVSEWFKELVLKTSDTARYRGFESHPLRQSIQGLG